MEGASEASHLSSFPYTHYSPDQGEWRGGQVAIKILHDNDVFNRQVLNEFRREAETMHIVGK